MTDKVAYPLQERDEAVRYLRDLLRINTANPPGNELPACEFLAGVLAAQGIESVILEPQPGRGNLVTRLRGDGRAAPLLLMAHVDVVPVEPENWHFPPFGAEISGGYLYGRGALDTKQLVAMELMVMLLLKRNQVPLARDVIFMASADEESGGRCGAGWMVKEHADLIRSEFAINEGGGFGSEILGKRIYSVQTAEKGTARFTLRARGRPGHGSMPHHDNAVLKLAAGLQRLGDAALPSHVVPTARLKIEGLAQILDGKVGSALRTLVDSRNGNESLNKLPLDEGMRTLLYAILHNTVTPTMLQAGTKINVIPSTAEAKVDARLLPGQTKETFLKELQAVLDRGLEIEFQDHVTPGIEFEPASPLYDTIKSVLRRHDPEATVLPDLNTGATDARHIHKLGAKVYGFCPMFDVDDEMQRVHGHDERISLDNVGFGTRVLYEVVSEFAHG
jgi:acetylornithine deacetylase/succinyl-diaminopimelate desuccinylase-like protein